MKEIWKLVVSFAGYEVSNFGRVRSVNRTISTKVGHQRKYVGRILGQATDGNGYSRVCFWSGNRQVGFIVHRLVAEAFLRTLQKDEEVNHIDFDKQNNHCSNLEIMTRADNVAHATAFGRMAKKLTETVVREIKFSLLWGDDKYSLARRFGVTREAINAIMWGKS